MARECFCGCGRQLGFVDRRLSTLGKRHDRLLAVLRATVVPTLKLAGSAGLQASERLHLGGSTAHDFGASLDNLEGFIREGERLRANLAAVVHRDSSVKFLARGRIGEWQGIALDVARTSAEDFWSLRRARQDAGVDVDREEHLGAWILASPLGPDAAGQAFLESTRRGVEQGLDPDQVYRRQVDAMAAGEELAF